MAAGQADFDVRDIADEAVAHDFRGLVEGRTERCHEPVCQMMLFF